MKNVLLSLALSTTVLSSLPLFAEIASSDKASQESSALQEPSLETYQKSIYGRSPIALGIEIGKQLTKAGLTCSISTVEVLTLMATSAYITIEKASNDPLTNLNKIKTDAEESWTFLMSRDFDLHGENKLCVESAYKLRLSALTAITKIYLNFAVRPQ